MKCPNPRAKLLAAALPALVRAGVRDAAALATLDADDVECLELLTKFRRLLASGQDGRS